MATIDRFKELQGSDLQNNETIDENILPSHWSIFFLFVDLRKDSAFPLVKFFCFVVLMFCKSTPSGSHPRFCLFWLYTDP